MVAEVHPLAIELAGKRAPRTPLEGKFSLAFCIALALQGHPASAADFSDERLHDSGVREIANRVEFQADSELRETAARLVMTMTDSREHVADIAFALGNPENPMQWSHMADKFLALTEPQLGPNAKLLFDRLRTVQTTADIAAIGSLLRPVAAPNRH